MPASRPRSSSGIVRFQTVVLKMPEIMSAAPAAAGIFVFPLYFASTAFVPKAALPDWLQTFNKINPLSYLIDAIRALMLHGWETEKIMAGFAAALVVGLITLPSAVIAFRRMVNS